MCKVFVSKIHPTHVVSCFLSTDSMLVIIVLSVGVQKTLLEITQQSCAPPVCKCDIMQMVAGHCCIENNASKPWQINTCRSAHHLLTECSSYIMSKLNMSTTDKNVNKHDNISMQLASGNQALYHAAAMLVSLTS